jgi:hypothetical protein
MKILHKYKIYNEINNLLFATKVNFRFQFRNIIFRTIQSAVKAKLTITVFFGSRFQC